MSDENQEQGRGPITSDEDARTYIRDLIRQTGSVPTVRKVADEIRTSPNRATELIKATVARIAEADALPAGIDPKDEESWVDYLSLQRKIATKVRAESRERIEEVEHNLAVAKAEHERLEAELAQSEQELVSATESARLAHSNAEEHLKSLGSLREAQSDALERAKAAEQRVQALSQDLKAQEASLAQANRTIEVNIQKAETARKEAADLHAREIQELTQEARKDAEAKQRQIDELLGENSTLSSSLADSTGELEGLQGRLEVLEKEHEDEIATVRDAHEALEQEHADTKTKLQAALADNAGLKSSLQQAEQHVASLKEATQMLGQKNDAATNQNDLIKALQVQIESLRDMLSKPHPIPPSD